METTVTINASGQKLGRIATQAAMILRGKNDPSFAPNKLSENTVIIENASLVDLSDAKLDDFEYKRFSGFPGGLSRETRRHVISRKGDDRGYDHIFRHAIRGMLPNNKLRDRMLKKLIVKA